MRGSEKNIALSSIRVVAVVLIVLGVGYFVLRQNKTPTDQPSLVSNATTSTVTRSEYKKVVGRTFEYGAKTDEQFGIARVAGGNGPSGLSIDAKGGLYINDSVNEKIKYIDAGLNQVKTVSGSFAELVSSGKGRSYSGKTYSTLVVEENQHRLDEPEIHITQQGMEEHIIKVSEPSLLSLTFLTEDEKGNAYFVAELDRSTPDGVLHVALKVLVYNPAGSIETTLLLPTDEADIYSETGLVHVNHTTGDIWQVAPRDNNFIVARWSRTY